MRLYFIRYLDTSYINKLFTNPYQNAFLTTAISYILVTFDCRFEVLIWLPNEKNAYKYLFSQLLAVIELYENPFNLFNIHSFL